jgi:predicted RNase H-like nuclease (RuvC/YqgF family)
LGVYLTKGIIVGIDTGLTVGIAILDTKGNVVDLTSKKEARKSEIVKHILKFGRPLVIASDVNPMPKAIEKIASSLGSKVYYPEVSLSNLEKIKIIQKYEKYIKDSHQKDALAACLKAFKHYHELFLKIEDFLKKIDKKEIYEKVVEEVMKSESENIVNATKRILERKDEKKIE